MTTAVWGSFVFSVDSNRAISFHDYTRKTSYKTEPKESGKNKPLTIDKGPELSSIGFKVQLIASKGVNVDTEAQKWHEACESGKPYALTIGGVKQGKNLWQLKDVSESAVTYAPDMRKLTAVLQINFIEYRGASTAASESAGKKTSTNKKTPSKKPLNNVPVAIDDTPITKKPVTLSSGQLSSAQKYNVDIGRESK